MVALAAISALPGGFRPAAGADVSVDIGLGAPAGEVEVLTRGPVHEAFAEPIAMDPGPGLVVPTEPPPAIEELPPDQEPAGGRAVWIPGYWGWDDDREGFIWVSGVWRDPPPGYSWVPGYWERARDGWMWVSGFWAPAEMEEIEYLPPPPPLIPEAPPPPPPAADRVWVPGLWYWRDGAYLWRPGHWVRAYPGWVWVPAHFVWTPRGAVFIRGHWDWSPDRRGLLFAPVYFQRDVYRRAGFRYSPAVALDLDGVIVNLFYRPRYCHYYFGDYYESRYDRIGIYPAFDADRRPGWYAPICRYREWRDPEWRGRQERDFQFRREHQEARPPRTFRQQQEEATLPRPERRNVAMATPLDKLAAEKRENLRLAKVAEPRREEIVQERQQLRDFRQERAKWESGEAAGAPPERPTVEPTPQRPAPPEARPPEAPKPPAPPEVRPPEAPKPPETPVGPPAEARPPAERPERGPAARPQKVKMPKSPVHARPEAPREEAPPVPEEPPPEAREHKARESGSEAGKPGEPRGSERPREKE